jgi:hypothetical protein
MLLWLTFKKAKNNNNSNDCITLLIKTSMNHTRELYIASKNSRNPVLKKYYKLCSKIRQNIIKEVKKMNYNTILLKSSNKNKTIWYIMKLETDTNFSTADTQVFDIEGKPCGQQAIADAFYNNFRHNYQ